MPLVIAFVNVELTVYCPILIVCLSCVILFFVCFLYTFAHLKKKYISKSLQPLKTQISIFEITYTLFTE